MVKRKKKTTDELIEELARNVKRGFDEMATRQELLSLEKRVETGFRVMEENFRIVRDELRELKLTRDLISRAVASEISELRSRISRIEKKVGLAK